MTGGDACFTSTSKETSSTSNSTDSTTTFSLPHNINHEDESETTVPTINVEEVASQNLFVISDDPGEWMINDFTRDHVATYGCNLIA